MGKFYFRFKYRVIDLMAIMFFVLPLITSMSTYIFYAIIFVFFLLLKNLSSKEFHSVIRYLLPILIMGALGVFSYFITFNSLSNNVLRDIYYLIIPALFLLIGFFSKNVYSLNTMYNNLITGFIVACLISGINILMDIDKLLNNLSIEVFRGIIGRENYISIISLFILCTQPCFKRKTIRYILIFTGIVLQLLYFSRISLLFVLSILFSYFIINRGKLLKKVRFKHICSIIAILVTCIISINLISPTLLTKFIDKIKYTFIEIDSDNKWGELADVNDNWRGYEIYCAKKLLGTYDIFEYFFGRGLGTTIPLDRYMYVGGNYYLELPILHNGYYSILTKYGVFGLVLYLVLFLSLIRKSRKCEMKRRVISMGCFVFLVIATFFVMGVIYLTELNILLMIGVYFAFENKEKKRIKQ